MLLSLGASTFLDPILGDDASNLEESFIDWTHKVMRGLLSLPGIEENPRVPTLVKGKGKGVNGKYLQQQDEDGLKRYSSFRKSQALQNKSVKENNSCCKAEEGAASKTGEGCCQSSGKGNVDEVEVEEEDLINDRFVTMDNEDISTSSGDACGVGGSDVLDLEDIGSSMSAQARSALTAQLKGPSSSPSPSLSNGGRGGGEREMVTKLQRKALVKEGYRIIGTHSAVKLCRWTKNQMRGRGGCLAPVKHASP